jgi:hypothetical protein
MQAKTCLKNNHENTKVRKKIYHKEHEDREEKQAKKFNGLVKSTIYHRAHRDNYLQLPDPAFAGIW